MIRRICQKSCSYAPTFNKYDRWTRGKDASKQCPDMTPSKTCEPTLSLREHFLLDSDRLVISLNSIELPL